MLELKNITKLFNPGTEDEKRALSDFSLTIEDGDFITVIGGNGAGKSTLQNIVSGALIPEEGQVILDGMDITHLPEYKRAKYLGRVYQDPKMGTAADMQIEENMELAACRGSRPTLAFGIRKSQRELFREKLAELDLGLEDRLESKVGTLSGGQRQAITLLMATFRSPKLLLLDEHTAALDPKTAAKVMDITNRIVCENKLTTLMITHNMRDAIAYGNRLIMLSDGKLVLDIRGEEKKNLTVSDLLEKFAQKSGKEFDNDRVMLS